MSSGCGEPSAVSVHTVRPSSGPLMEKSPGLRRPPSTTSFVDPESRGGVSPTARKIDDQQFLNFFGFTNLAQRSVLEVRNWRNLLSQRMVHYRIEQSRSLPDHPVPDLSPQEGAPSASVKQLQRMFQIFNDALPPDQRASWEKMAYIHNV